MTRCLVSPHPIATHRHKETLSNGTALLSGLFLNICVEFEGLHPTRCRLELAGDAGEVMSSILTRQADESFWGVTPRLRHRLANYCLDQSYSLICDMAVPLSVKEMITRACKRKGYESVDVVPDLPPEVEAPKEKVEAKALDVMVDQLAATAIGMLPDSMKPDEPETQGLEEQSNIPEKSVPGTDKAAAEIESIVKEEASNKVEAAAASESKSEAIEATDQTGSKDPTEVSDTEAGNTPTDPPQSDEGVSNTSAAPPQSNLAPTIMYDVEHLRPWYEIRRVKISVLEIMHLIQSNKNKVAEALQERRAKREDLEESMGSSQKSQEENMRDDGEEKTYLSLRVTLEKLLGEDAAKGVPVNEDVWLPSPVEGNVYFNASKMPDFPTWQPWKWFAWFKEYLTESSNVVANDRLQLIQKPKEGLTFYATFSTALWELDIRQLRRLTRMYVSKKLAGEPVPEHEAAFIANYPSNQQGRGPSLILRDKFDTIEKETQGIIVGGIDAE
eukprot:Blabericola_migrator_1__9368@NODE_504_length_7967_cov_171_363291_g386_i0_p3_GENE_NODE_504_length_7967_cov_171_363291_g386_i0NODE_504_length_7967_cov_171_363291_g386_i0_p3_ORF_typecomplete_len501_score106_36_NODE_504_length_7967_cov_171_363291_g386_i025374039